MKTCKSPRGDGSISKVFWDIIEKDFIIRLTFFTQQFLI
jgi:hypothetical protein